MIILWVLFARDVDTEYIRILYIIRFLKVEISELKSFICKVDLEYIAQAEYIFKVPVTDEQVADTV